MTRHLLVVEADEVSAGLGYYGPYISNEEAMLHFNVISLRDETARLVWRTEAQLELRADEAARRRREKALIASLPTALL